MLHGHCRPFGGDLTAGRAVFPKHSASLQCGYLSQWGLIAADEVARAVSPPVLGTQAFAAAESEGGMGGDPERGVFPGAVNDPEP